VALLLFGGASVHAHETSGSSWGNATAIAALLGAAACLVTGVGCIVAATRRRS